MKSVETEGDPMRNVLTLTRRDLMVGAAALAALSLAGPLAAQGVRPVVEMSLGSPDAPVTLIEYASFTCPHCAAFNKDVMPRIKAEYIDTGKVRLVYREVYFDGPSLWASVVARCAGRTGSSGWWTCCSPSRRTGLMPRAARTSSRG